MLINVDVSRKPPFKELPLVQEKVRKAEAILGENGRVILRYSGTEPKARVMVEGREAREVEDLARAIAQTIQSEIGLYEKE